LSRTKNYNFDSIDVSTGPALLGITAVERDCGIAKETLRVWERRYGFPQPTRDAQGERAYLPDDVIKLRLIRRLLDQGHRPGRILARSAKDLADLLDEAHAVPAVPLDPAVAELITLIREHQAEQLNEALRSAVIRLGLGPFITGLAAPTIRAVGEGWARGEIEVYQEHLFTEQLSRVIRTAINALPITMHGNAQGGSRPRVLLTTFPREPHSMGLLMVEAILALDHALCFPLGTETPLPDIVAAATAHEVDIVALSFSPWAHGGQAIEGLNELRRLLPSRMALWAGGSCPALERLNQTDIEAVTALEMLPQSIATWRKHYGS
jgi:MerR family transcriptional regulator, light-induced transcriptional regulator